MGIFLDNSCNIHTDYRGDHQGSGSGNCSSNRTQHLRVFVRFVSNRATISLNRLFNCCWASGGNIKTKRKGHMLENSFKPRRRYHDLCIALPVSDQLKTMFAGALDWTQRRKRTFGGYKTTEWLNGNNNSAFCYWLALSETCSSFSPSRSDCWLGFVP